MRDIIDERNEKERISRSIVKFWNVNYVPIIEKTEDEPQEPEACENVVGSEELTDELYNETTKSYSGVYGLEAVEDEVTKGQIDKILQEKDEALRQLLDQKSKDVSGGEL